VRVRISSLDKKFPAALRFKGGPTHLEAIGELAEKLDVPMPVAIVGTRRPRPEAWQYTYWLAAELAKKGATIISGGAYGIDSAAHEGALSVGKPTIAFLPTSVDRYSPAGNSGLFNRIAATGALIGFRETRDEPRFHERNAAIAAMVDDVIMVAAPMKSGARNTANEARHRGKNLWVVPGSPFDATMAGCAMELLLGAKPIVSPQPILHARGLQYGITHQQVILKELWRSAPFDPNPAPPLEPLVTEPLRPASAPTPIAYSSLKRPRTMETL
jgi:DNA processing protein